MSNECCCLKFIIRLLGYVASGGMASLYDILMAFLFMHRPPFSSWAEPYHGIQLVKIIEEELPSTGERQMETLTCALQPTN